MAGGFGMFDKILTKGGNRAGQAVGAATGAVQLIGAAQAKKKAMAATPEGVDATQGAFLAELQQKRNAINTGAQYSSSIDAINDKMAQTQDVIAGNSGGDAGGTISALLKSQQVANQGVGQVMAQGQQAEGMYTGLYGDLLNKVAQRKMELGLLSRGQNMAEWAQKKQAGAANFLTGAQNFMDWKGGDKKAQTPATGTAAPVMPSMSGGGSNQRQGVEGFNLGVQNQNLGGAGPDLGATNPLGNIQANEARKSGINLDSLRNKANVTGGGKSGGGNGGGFMKLLSGFGK